MCVFHPKKLAIVTPLIKYEWVNKIHRTSLITILIEHSHKYFFGFISLGETNIDKCQYAFNRKKGDSGEYSGMGIFQN